jgi:hypothetical protein
VYLDGGNLIRQALDAELVDELTITLVPVVLGEGLPLLAGTKARHALERVHVREAAGGLVQLTYRRVRSCGLERMGLGPRDEAQARACPSRSSRGSRLLRCRESRSPAWASALAISSRVVVIFAKRMGHCTAARPSRRGRRLGPRATPTGVETLARAPAAARSSRHRRPNPPARARWANSRHAPARPRRGPLRAPRARHGSGHALGVAALNRGTTRAAIAPTTRLRLRSRMQLGWSPKTGMLRALCASRRHDRTR